MNSTSVEPHISGQKLCSDALRTYSAPPLRCPRPAACKAAGSPLTKTAPFYETTGLDDKPKTVTRRKRNYTKKILNDPYLMTV